MPCVDKKLLPPLPILISLSLSLSLSSLFHSLPLPSNFLSLTLATYIVRHGYYNTSKAQFSFHLQGTNKVAVTAKLQPTHRVEQYGLNLFCVLDTKRLRSIIRAYSMNPISNNSLHCTQTCSLGTSVHTHTYTHTA